MGKGVWPFINGNEQEPILGATLTILNLKTFKEWHEGHVLVVNQCFKLHDCAYIGCKDAKGGMGYFGKDVQHQYHYGEDVTQIGVA